mmetsp:Transcript_1626/g.3958  ORF Transcript_1626/g.3958 Transcript_1626/m.3958 type:complete len:327 (+) Transcript_1626:555-1535(+)
MSGLWEGVRDKIPGEEALLAPAFPGREAFRVHQVQQEALRRQGGPDDAHEVVRERLRVQLRHPAVLARRAQAALQVLWARARVARAPARPRLGAGRPWLERARRRLLGRGGGALAPGGQPPDARPGRPLRVGQHEPPRAGADTRGALRGEPRRGGGPGPERHGRARRRRRLLAARAAERGARLVPEAPRPAASRGRRLARRQPRAAGPARDGPGRRRSGGGWGTRRGAVPRLLLRRRRGAAELAAAQRDDPEPRTRAASPGGRHARHGELPHAPGHAGPAARPAEQRGPRQPRRRCRRRRALRGRLGSLQRPVRRAEPEARGCTEQ